MFYLTYTCLLSKEVRTGTQAGQELEEQQELMQRPWNSAASWLVPYALFILLSYSTQDQGASSETESPTMGWSLSINH